MLLRDIVAGREVDIPSRAEVAQIGQHLDHRVVADDRAVRAHRHGGRERCARSRDTPRIRQVVGSCVSHSGSPWFGFSSIPAQGTAARTSGAITARETAYTDSRSGPAVDPAARAAKR